MSRKGHKNKVVAAQPEPQAVEGGFKDLSLQELNALAKAAPIALHNRLAKALSSESFEDVVKAQTFIAEEQRKSKVIKPDVKSILWNPSQLGYSGKGYQDPNNGIPFSTLNRMGEIFIIKAIINTRIEQVQNFLKYSTDDQKPGYRICYKKGYAIFDEKEQDIKKTDRAAVEKIVKFLEDGGENDKWACEDNFQEFTRKVLRDSLVLDQLAFEVVRSRDLKVKRFRAVDAALVRLLDSNDPRYADQFEQYRWHGFLPKFGMVWDGQIIRHPITNELVMFYPWELGYGIRNKTTNVLRNGYGCSELETLIEIATWILWGMQYNGNFFKQGSQPKGFINIKNGNIDQGTLNEFKQELKQTMATVYNSHRVPVLQGLDLEWIDLQHSNRDMEFTEWVKFLMVLTCAVYRIDPSELGFQFQDASRIFGQDGQRERLDHSKKKGLTPLLIFYQNILNKYIISELDERFELRFTGIEVEDEAAQVELDKKKLEAGMASVEDMFEKYSGRKLNPEKDTLLNSVWVQQQTNKMMGGEDMNAIADSEGGGPQGEEGESPDDVDAFIDQLLMQKSQQNPILGKALEFINNQLTK